MKRREAFAAMMAAAAAAMLPFLPRKSNPKPIDIELRPIPDELAVSPTVIRFHQPPFDMSDPETRRDFQKALKELSGGRGLDIV